MFPSFGLLLVTINLDALACLIPLALVALPITVLLADRLLTSREIDTTEQAMITLIARQQRNDSCLTSIGMVLATMLLVALCVAAITVLISTAHLWYNQGK